MRPFRQNWVSILPLIAVTSLAVTIAQSAVASATREPDCATTLCRYQALQEILKNHPADPTARLKLAEYYANRRQFASAAPLIQQLRSEFPQDTEIRLIDAEVKLGSGMKGEAFRHFDRLAKEQLNPAMQLRVAKGLASLGFKDRALKLAESVAASDKTAWNDVLLLATEIHDGTSQERARRALARLGEQQAEVSQTQPAIDESEFLARMAPAANHQVPAGTRMLSDARVDQFGEEGLISQRIQQWIQLGQNAALPVSAIREIKYSPKTQQIEVLSARLHKRNGAIAKGSRLPDERAEETTAQMYYGLSSLRLQFAGAEPGDVIELDYRVTPKADELLSGVGDVVSFGVSMPTDVKSYMLLASGGANPQVAFERVGTPSLQILGRSRVTTWKIRDLQPTASEPRSPASAEVAGYVSVSRFKNWQQLGSWYAENVRAQFALTPELKDAVKKLTAHSTTDLERIKAIQQFVLRNTHYVALEFGAYSYKPYRVSDVYARRFGDCKDKASLMISMLGEAGIRAELALIRTHKLGAIASDSAVLSAFNHAIVYIPGHEIWIDATADYGAINELPVEDQGAMALTVALDGRSQMRRVPESKPEDNATRRTIVADVHQDGTLSFRASQRTRGEEAPSLRRDLESPDRQRDSLQRGLAEMLPAVQVNEVQVSRGERERVDIDFGGEVNSYRGKKRLSVNSTWYARRYVRTLAPLLSRTQDLVITAPWRTEEEVRMNLPAGARVSTLPREFVRNTQFGTATIGYEVRDRVLIMRSAVEISKGRVAPGQYSAFRQFCTELDNAFREQVSITIQ
jgi:cellulose synthase operon protein C